MFASRSRSLSAAGALIPAFALLVGPAAAQPLFGPVTTFAAPGGRGIAVAEFNGDGNPDLAISDSGSGAVLILPGNGDGTFGAPASFAVGSGPYTIACADLNADRKLDLVTANGNDDTVSVLLGNGTGGFAPSTSFPVANNPVCVKIADLNGDQRPDLVTSNFAGANGTVSVLLANGGGAFASAVHYPSGPASDDVVIGDWNADGKPDAAVTNRYADRMALLAGDGLGGFAAPTHVAVAAGSPATSAVADMNGDGRSDLVVTTYDGASSAVSVLLGDGAGGFVPAASVLVGSFTFAVAAGDLNGDGKTDVVVGDGVKNSNSMYLLLGDGTGSLSAPTPLPIGSTPMYIAIADVDRDGRPDLVTPQFWVDTVAVLLGSGAVFANATFPVAPQPRALATADVTGDGLPDIVTANQSGGRLSVLANNGGGAFAAPSNFPLSGNPGALALGDLDGDGRPDAVTTNSSSVSVLLNNGSGGFPVFSNFPTASNPVAVALEDVNGDGRRDALTANFGSGNISVLLGNGAGGFGPLTNYAAGGSPTALAIADFDGDGDVDAAVSNASTGLLTVLANDGAGAFSMQSQFFAGGSGVPTAMAAGDLNGDGAMDLVLLEQNFGSQVVVLLGDGAGGFLTASIVAQGSATALTLGDMDDDGVIDVATASSSAGTVTILRGDGAGNFAPWITATVGTQPSALVSADWNGDGAPDLACANAGSNTVSVLSSRGLLPYGSGTFGCYGILGMNGSAAARINQPSFALTVTNAPRRSAGTMILGAVPDLAGTILPAWSLKLHVSPAGSLVFFGAVSDFAGVGRAPLPIPDDPALVGLRAYAQSLWIEDAANGQSISQAFARLVSSRGLAITLLP